MKANSLLLIFLLLLLTLNSCNQISPDKDFGAYYTKIESEEAFEQYSRTGDYPDIIVDLGSDNGKVVFWRGSSYLPYFENSKGEQSYFPQIIERMGNGSGSMPDRVNTYSHTKIIKSNPDSVVIHWRYLRNFEIGNPDIGVSPEGFVDEYFKIFPDGKVSREIIQGRAKTNDWNNPGNLIRQDILVLRNGIQLDEVVNYELVIDPIVVEGAELLNQGEANTVISVRFDEGIGEQVKEDISEKAISVSGRKVLWRSGVSGTALQFDGYNSEISLPADISRTISNDISLQAFVSLGAYPWSWCPIIQQCDDVPEEIERIQKHGNYSTSIKKENETGFFLGISGEGKPGFKLNVGGSWEELSGDLVLERREWYLLTATYSNDDGLMRIYVDDKQIAVKKVKSGSIVLSNNDIRIGRGKARRPINPVRRNTFPGQFAFDGLIDEVKIFNSELSEREISGYFSSSKAKSIDVDMDKRVLPAGDYEMGFGAEYKHLKYYDIWDNLWCFSDHPDIVVGFDNKPSKFVFWRGVSYIPMMVNEKGQWYSNEFNETWGTSGGDGCQEPMSDKGNYFTYARILENTPARVLVHYRFPLADVNLVKANYVEETGWYDVADWYYYIYPDGIAVKRKHLWTSGDRNHEWQESMAIFGPDQHPEQIIETTNTVTMQNMSGETKSYNWTKAPPPNVDEPAGQCIQIVNYTGEYDPITIGEAFEGSNVYGGELTPYSVFPTWNHWPVAQMPSDGRYASFPDRTGHSSLTHVYLPIYDEAEGDKPFYEKLLMEGMLKTDETDLVRLAKSWNNAPEIQIEGEGEAWYDKAQRAYIVDGASDKLELTVLANNDKPIVNLCFVISDWGKEPATEIRMNDKVYDAKQGIVRERDGSYKLVVWIKVETEEEIKIKVER